MAKQKGMRPPPGMNRDLMDKITRMREEMLQAQAALAQERLTVSVGGDAVTVVIDGQQRVHHIKISPDALAQGDREMLEDLLVAAINSAIEQSQTRAAERLQGLSSDVGLPDL